MLGTWIALVPLAMIFAGLVAATLALRGGSPGAPPQPRSLGLGALALVAPCLAIRAARAAAARSRSVRPWIAAAALLGTLFLGNLAGVWQELAASGFAPGRSALVSCFYVLTGTYAVQLAGGLTGLGLLFFWPSRAWRGTPLMVALQAASVYWTFAAGTWLVLLTVLQLAW